MFNRANQVKALALLLSIAPLTASAQQPVWRSPAQTQRDSFRPVPAMRPVAKQSATAAPTHQRQPDGWNLKWRQSGNIRPVPKSKTDVFAQPTGQPRQQPEQPNPIRQVSGQSLGPQANAIRQSAWQQDSPATEDDFFTKPFGLPTETPEVPPKGNVEELPPPANLPGPANVLRGNDAGPRVETLPLPPAAEPEPELALPMPSNQDQPVAPSIPLTPAVPAEATEPTPPAQPAPPATEPTPPVQPVPPPATEPAPRVQPAPPVVPEPEPAPAEESLRDLLRDQPFTPPDELAPSNPFNNLPKNDTESSAQPSDAELFQRPFDVQRLRERMEQSRQGSEAAVNDWADKVDPKPGLSCQDFRQRISQDSIRDVSLDISAPFRPDVLTEEDYNRFKDEFDEKQPSREWKSIDGRLLAKGRLRDLAYEQAVIETDFGTTEEVPMNRLSESDLGYISQNWGLPMTCLLPQAKFQPRQWTRTAVTWKASELCHKPLYFEDVNLERYGHTHGPLVEPIVSSAHFFANIAVLPYKMGVHSPHECQYALGYYRPGNCAPWIKPPVPISLRGALFQGAAMAGVYGIIP